MVRLIVVAALAAACGGAIAKPPAPAGQVLEEGVLQNQDIEELSGLAVSRADPALLWGHNDSGDGPNLFRIGLHGEDLGKVTIEGAQAGDWEDIAAYGEGKGAALLIADTGDDFGLRAYGTLYAVTDPGRRGDPALLWKLDFQYPDGSHDCEAIAVDPLAHAILLVTKRDKPARLYRLPLPERAPAGRQTAEFVGTLDPSVRKPTAMDISADGLTAVVVTLHDAYVYRRQSGQAWLDVFRQPVRAIALPRFKQIESGALAPDGKSLYVGSETLPARWARLELPPS